MGVEDYDRQLANYRSLDLTPPPDWARLHPRLDELRATAAAEPDAVSLVFPRRLARMEQVITRLHLAEGKKPGIFDTNFEDPDRYGPVDPDVPLDRPYLVTGFEPGIEYRNLPPDQALTDITDRGRLPLTIEEGLAVFLHDPETLQRNACWSLAGSRRGDRRVPALWISANAPKLGWCYAGAPHTWLGTASIAARVVT